VEGARRQRVEHMASEKTVASVAAAMMRAAPPVRTRPRHRIALSRSASRGRRLARPRRAPLHAGRCLGRPAVGASRRRPPEARRGMRGGPGFSTNCEPA
jgi:hypothetical protein